MKLANFDDLERWGIIETINNEILHSLGLKLIKNNDGTSPGCLISDSLFFDSKKEDDEETKQKFSTFIKNRYYYLTNYIDIKEYQEKMKKEINNKISQSKEKSEEDKLIAREYSKLTLNFIEDDE